MRILRWLLCLAVLFFAEVVPVSASPTDTAAAVYLDTPDGRAAYTAALRAQFGAGDAEEEARLAQLIAPLAAAAQMDAPRVLVTARENPNMYALPGVILVNRGMIALVTDDGERSVLLAHELGHLAADHPMRGIHRGLRSNYFLRRANRKAAAWQKENAAASEAAAQQKESATAPEAAAQKTLNETAATKETEEAREALQEGAKAFVQAAIHAEIGIEEERAADRFAAALLPRVGIPAATAVGLWDHLKAAGISDASHSHPSYRERKKIYGQGK